MPSICWLPFALALFHPGNAEDTEGIGPFTARATAIVAGPADHPGVLLEVLLAQPLVGPLRLLSGDGAELQSLIPQQNAAGVRVWLQAPWPAADEPVLVIVAGGAPEHRQSVSYTRPATDYVLHFVPGFHYDPVWWNTQANYTETGRLLDAHTGPGLTLMGEYLRKLDDDPDYRVAFHQLPYLKTFLEARPAQRDELLQRVTEGRAGLVGGTYNELSSTLVGAEAIIRNAVYGMAFQRGVLGGAGDAFWQCDVFGHDPSFPSLMLDSGHLAGAFARGPFHQWGIDRPLVNFPSEFRWMGPDGRSILTHYMTGHYGYAYARFASGATRASDDPQQTDGLIAAMFEDLRIPALTHHVLLPMHTDFVRPLENLGEVVRRWNETHVSPRAVIDTSAGFFGAVAAEIDRRELVVPVITRDMNPIYTGCGVSFADLKLANRAAESTLRDAELFATLAALEGAAFPGLAIDRAWRQLLFCAHHDGITGSMSDQVYLEILACYRDALELAREVCDRSLTFLEQHLARAAGRTIAWNPTAAARSEWLAASGRIEEIPAVGYRLLDAPTDAIAAGTANGTVLQNEHLRVTIDPQQGGAITSIVWRADGRELLRGPANELVTWEEYGTLPGQGEGPWHLAPTGRREPGTGCTSRVLPADPQHPHRLVVESEHRRFRARRSVELLPGARQIDCETHILGWTGRDELLRVEFPIDLPHARPVFGTAAAAIGRNFARDVDAAQDPWTLDQSFQQFVELGATCTLEYARNGTTALRQSLSVGMIGLPADASAEHRRLANELAQALVESGVTTTIVGEDQRDYGDLTFDSNHPDFRIQIARHTHGSAGAAWVGVVQREWPLPMLVISQPAVAAVCERLRREHRIVADHVDLPAMPIVADFGVALLTTGVSSAQVRADGTMALNLLRSNTSWPAGVWIDGAPRRLPDGAPIETMHGDHVFRYSLLPHPGDHRQAGVAGAAQDFNQPLRVRESAGGTGDWPASRSLLSIDPQDVRLLALKPSGNPAAAWHSVPADPVRDGLIARIWNAAGERRTAHLRMHRPIRSAARCDLLERRGHDLPIEDGAVTIEIGANEIASVWLQVDGAPRATDAAPLEPRTEQVTPSAYWLTNLGEGVTGNGEIAVVCEPRELVLSQTAQVSIHLINNRRDASAVLDLFVIAPDTIDVRLDQPQITLAAASSVVVPLRLSARDGWSGRVPACVEVRTRVDGDRVVSGVLWLATATADLERPAIRLEPLAEVIGADQPLIARIANDSDGPIDGVLSLLAPFATWQHLPEWRRELTIPPRAALDVALPTHGSIDSFAMLRFAHADRLAFAGPIALCRDPQRVLLTFAVDRVRLRPAEPTRVLLRARSIAGLDADSAVRLEAPGGVSAVAVPSDPGSDPGGRGITLAFDVTAGADARPGILRAIGPQDAVAEVPYTVAPLQRARSAAHEIRIDGDLGEWQDDEFTQADGRRGRVRTAVRHGTTGLTIAMQVDDDSFHQTSTDATLWQGDSIQLALSLAPGESLGYSARDFEFGAALSPSGPLVWCWYGGDGGATGRVVDAMAAIRAIDGEIRYEFTLPRAALGRIPLLPGTTLGFSYIANDDDGEGYAGASEWTAGMVGAKDASLFGELELLPSR